MLSTTLPELSSIIIGICVIIILLTIMVFVIFLEIQKIDRYNKNMDKMEDYFRKKGYPLVNDSKGYPTWPDKKTKDIEVIDPEKINYE